MTVNSLYPYFARLKYSANAHTHWMTIPLGAETGGIPAGESADNYTFFAKNGTELDFAACMDDFVALLAPFFKTTDSFILAELWGMATPESDPIFYTAYELGVAGTSANPNVANSQAVMTFRTAAGGILKLYLMEGVNGANGKDDYPFAAAANQNLGAYMIGGTNIIRGRDGAFPISPLRYVSKTNDALRKKYLLDG